jgi:hypothetical protein
VQDQGCVTEFKDRAKKIRQIARGIFDKAEREILLKFVSDSEKLAEEKARMQQAALGD